jgi:hypothetical protein
MDAGRPRDPWAPRGPWSGQTSWRHGLRQVRGSLLVLLALPLAPTLLVNALGGSGKQVLGTLLGMGGVALAVRALRGGHGRKRAAVLTGLATALLAAMAAHVPVVGAVLFGVMAWFGAMLLYEGVADPVPQPVPVPKSAAAPDALAVPRGRLAALAAGPAVLRPAVSGLQDLLAELERQPAALSESRRFLNIQLDGLERIVARLRAGAEPGPALNTLVAEMAEGSAALRTRLRAAESEALDIQIKVLSERLREEGFA